MNLSAFPITLVDIVGSVLMILLSFACVRQVARLREKDPQNVIWTYLFWVSMALAGFAVSRSAGHLIKQVLLFSHHTRAWGAIRPYSGSVNTIMFVVVGAVTLYFERSWKIYEQIMWDRQSLEKAHEELVYLNQNLEDLVLERNKALALSEHNYRRIFEISKDMIVVTQKDGTIKDINPAGVKMIACSEDAPLAESENIRSFFADPGEWDALREKLNQNGFTSNEEINIRTKEGMIRRTLVSSGLDEAKNEDESTLHFMVKDIENRKMMEQQIAQADKLASIGQLSSGIAHEINNPLGIILGYTQLLLRNENPENEKYQDLKTIEKHVRTCKTIVEDLLNFARSSKPSEDSVQVNKSLEDVISFVQHHSRFDGVEVIKHYDAGMPYMVLDEKKIKQVFMNLIMNARHAVGKTGRIVISTVYDPARKNAVISVEDNGYGIEKKDLQRIFDPFFTTKPTGEGTGLGLSVSYGIVKNHGGEILVESRAGEGTSFKVVLPVRASAET